MANPHYTPDLPAAKTEHTIIVGYRPQGANKNTPSLTLSGKWLCEAGFETGQQVSVTVMEGCTHTVYKKTASKILLLFLILIVFHNIKFIKQKSEPVSESHKYLFKINMLIPFVYLKLSVKQ